MCRRRLHAAIGHEIKPETFFDKIRVREFTDKLWQQQRCKQSAASIVEGAYVEALASLLRLFNPKALASIGEDFAALISLGEDFASRTARKYYGGETTFRVDEDIELLLAKYRITQEQIRAKAMQLCGGAVMIFCRMESHCDTSLRMLRKENERRGEVENSKSRGSDQK